MRYVRRWGRQVILSDEDVIDYYLSPSSNDPETTAEDDLREELDNVATVLTVMFFELNDESKKRVANALGFTVQEDDDEHA